LFTVYYDDKKLMCKIKLILR